MKRAVKKVCGFVLTCIFLTCSFLAMPLTASAVNIEKGPADTVINVNTTEIAFAGHEWLVIGYNGSGVCSTSTDVVTLLLKNGDAGNGFAESVFDVNGVSNIYEGSALHAAMQDVYAGIDSREKKQVAARDLDEIAAGSSGAVLGRQYAWPLSNSEWNALGNAARPYTSAWWMRSRTSSHPYLANYGAETGDSVMNGHVSGPYAVRPAININLASSVVFTSDATGAGAKASENADANLTLVPDPLTHGKPIKFTFTDSGLALSRANATSVSGNTIFFDYTISATSGYNRLSAIVTDSAGDAVKYYGNLLDNPVASGSASVTVPDGLAATDQLYVFVEQVNGNADTTAQDSYLYSDFASEPVQIGPLATQAEAPTGLAGVDCTTAANKNGKITGTTIDMEYSNNSGSSWKPCADVETTGLTPGTYQVRYKAQTVNGILAVHGSPTTTVTIGAFPVSPNGQHRQQGSSPSVRSTGSPQTGDTTNLPLWALCGGSALLILIMCGAVLRKFRGRNIH